MTKDGTHKASVASSEKPKKKKRQSTYTWDVVRAERDYITNPSLTLQDIAKKYGVNKRTVSRYSIISEWTRKRRECSERGLEKSVEKHADLIAERNEKHMALWRSAQNAASSAMVRAHKANNTKEVATAIYALQTAIDGERKTLGLPTVINKTDDTKSDKKEDLNLVEAARRAEKLLKEKGIADGTGIAE